MQSSFTGFSIRAFSACMELAASRPFRHDDRHDPLESEGYAGRPTLDDFEGVRSGIAGDDVRRAVHA
ncbi:MAG TPA: hypothetical protein VMS43_06155 [Allosphingosinicella sp.]|nr:hypothetical protein [Allosphingosinicella sp.]